jgi:hypothetical protein
MPEVCDVYELEVEVPPSFPKGIPRVKELQGKIPRNANFHVNGDESLCLGSPIRLLKNIGKAPTLSGFAATCIVPFLYAVTNKLQNGGQLAFSELAHGERGILDDYMELMGLKRREEVPQALDLLGIKRRIANKQACPCKCGRRLGECSFHRKLNEFRGLAPRSWFKLHHSNLGAGM